MLVCYSDFQEVTECGYRPGIIRYGTTERIISVSIPIVALARLIPLRALVAWDKRLLMRTQYLTLLISNVQGKWPVLGPDGVVSSVVRSVPSAPGYIKVSSSSSPTSGFGLSSTGGESEAGCGKLVANGSWITTSSFSTER